LVKEPTMKLSNMQDIAGCRAVVASMRDVRAVVDRWRHHVRAWVVEKEYDYVENPKISGYRAYHLVVSNGERRVEVQLRTEVQHEWAVTVERVGGRTRDDLKGGSGPSEVLDFFRLVSIAMGMEEQDQVVPRELIDAVKAARRAAEPLMKRERL
jgi:ppGpp synthetase/RelA/SpoT-type nucleotidyltranferase